MTHYHPFHPDHEFLGRVVLNLQTALGSGMVHDIFARHGLGDVDPEAWYPVQLWFDAINEIASSEAAMIDLVGLGMKSVQNVNISPEARAMPVSDYLQGAAKTYPNVNRGTDIGEARGEVVDEHHVRMILRMPHPDDFWYGAYYSLMKQLLPPGTPFKVYYDKEIPRRELGGKETILHIEWDPFEVSG
jgi:hypothetical protein